MLRLWSPRHKFNTWRRIWLAVAEAQHEVTKDWGSVSSERAPTVREGAPADASNPLPHGRGSSGVRTGPLVTSEQVEALRAVVERGITDDEIARATEIERDLRHDVMAHVHCLGESCPEAKAIIHLGCTSQDVVCNADLIILHEAIWAILGKCVRAISSLGDRAVSCKAIPTLGFTHYQTAQPTTVGKRLATAAYEIDLARRALSSLVIDESIQTNLPLRGFRGATGTQASFLALFDGDRDRVDEFEARAVASLSPTTQFYVRPPFVESVDEQLGRERQNLKRAEDAHSRGEWYGADIDELRKEIESRTESDYNRWTSIDVINMLTFQMTGQTYPREIDTEILSRLASIAAVLHKIATDIRLLSNRKEIDEPFGSKQIGSSAMPYKPQPHALRAASAGSRASS